MLIRAYDETNPLSIEQYSQKLIGKTFADVLIDDSKQEIIQEDSKQYGISHENKKRKGGLGELIEECFFHYQSNSNSNPDFDKAGVELKVSPYKVNKNKTLSAKERLIITMINYEQVINEDFLSSHLWAKCKLILLVYYLYDKNIDNRLDYTINYSKLFSPSEADLEIIKNDYVAIINKIRDGKAHELSEGDTLYLGAATKSSTSKNRRTQPFSNIPAKPRAFSFKTSYMTHVLNTYIVPNKSTYEPIIKDLNDLKGTSFKEYIISRINSYIGKSDEDLCTIFNRKYNNNNSQWCDLSYRMLGIKSNQAEEFIKANIVVKAIRIEENAKMVESMSFPAFTFKKLVKESWEESDLYTYFNDKIFLFVVFKKYDNSYILKGAKLWNMPYEDLNNIVYTGWNNFCTSIRNGVSFKIKNTEKGPIVTNNLPKKCDNPILHMRPHSKKSAYALSDGTIIGNVTRDANELPDGQWMTTQSFWINNSYILYQLNMLNLI